MLPSTKMLLSPTGWPNVSWPEPDEAMNVDIFFSYFVVLAISCSTVLPTKLFERILRLRFAQKYSGSSVTAGDVERVGSLRCNVYLQLIQAKRSHPPSRTTSWWRRQRSAGFSYCISPRSPQVPKERTRWFSAIEDPSSRTWFGRYIWRQRLTTCWRTSIPLSPASGCRLSSSRSRYPLWPWIFDSSGWLPAAQFGICPSCPDTFYRLAGSSNLLAQSAGRWHHLALRLSLQLLVHFTVTKHSLPTESGFCLAFSRRERLF